MLFFVSFNKLFWTLELIFREYFATHRTLHILATQMIGYFIQIASSINLQPKYATFTWKTIFVVIFSFRLNDHFYSQKSVYKCQSFFLIIITAYEVLRTEQFAETCLLRNTGVNFTNILRTAFLAQKSIKPNFKYR